MTRTYKYGYGTWQTRLTEAELNTKWTWAMVHPEFRRRAIRMMDHGQDSGHDLGIGSGARDPKAQLAEALRRHTEVPCGGRYNRRYNGKCYLLKPGMAPYAFPGSSNHETGILDGYAIAIDFIGWEDHWFDKNCERFGIKNFGGAVGPNVNSEEWHGQPIEFANSRSAVNAQISAGLRLVTIPLPGDPPPKPKPPISKDNIDMLILDLNPGTAFWVALLLSGNKLSHIVNGNHVKVMERGGVRRVSLGTNEVSGEAELSGILQAVETTNDSPFVFGRPSHNQSLHDAWLLAATK